MHHIDKVSSTSTTLSPIGENKLRLEEDESCLKETRDKNPLVSHPIHLL